MVNYRDLLNDIEILRKDKKTTDRVQLMKINECVIWFNISILYYKIKDEPAFLKDVQKYSHYIDKYLYTIDYLYQFFGCIDMDEIDEKMKVLKQKMSEINKVFSN
jgi:hypothetical protein